MGVGCIGVLAVSSLASLSQNVLQGATAFDTLVRTIEAHLATHKVPGVAVAVVRGDSIVFARGFGVSNVSTRQPVTPDMLFRAGSASKMFTAALVTRLAAEGSLQLQAPVSRYVTGLDPAIGRLTLDRLLAHSAGLKDEAAAQGSEDEAALATHARSWTGAYAMLPSGTAFSYSNGGYALAGLIAQEATSSAFADLAAQRLFTPLGMTRTTYRSTSARAHSRAVGYAPPEGSPPNSDSVLPQPYSDDTRFWPAGYAYTSARDFARFLIAIMNGGRIDGRQVLPEAVARAMLTPRIPVPNIFANAHYGYGLFIGPYRGTTSAWHDGQMPGFGALVRMIPERREGLVILLNRSNVRMDAIGDAAFDALGVTAAPATPQAVSLIPMAQSEMRRYAGRYVNRWPIELVVRDGALYRSWVGQEARVYKIGAQRFTVDSARMSRSAEFTMVPASAARPAYIQVALWAFVRSAADSGRAVLERALEAAGGESALRSLMATSADVSIAGFGRGQEQRPGGLASLRARSGVLIQDFVGRRSRFLGEHRHRQHTFPYEVVVTPATGYQASWGRRSALSAVEIASRMRALDLSAERILLTALDSRCAVGAAGDVAPRLGAIGGVRTLRCGTSPDTFRLHFDGATGRLLAHEAFGDDPVLGRTVTVTRYDDFRPVYGGPRVVLPHLVYVEANGQLSSVTQMGRIESVQKPSDSVFMISEELRGAAAGSTPISVSLEELAPNVHHVISGAYRSLAVIQGDSILVADLPESDARAGAILDTLRSRFPGAPVRLVILSHHHADHAGGLRAGFARRLPVLTHEANVAFVRGIGRPTAVEARQRVVRGLRDNLTIGSGAGAVRVYAVSNPHADGTLLVYVPAARLLYAADLAEHGPWEVEREGLVENVRRLGLRPERVAPGHAPVRRWAEIDSGSER